MIRVYFTSACHNSRNWCHAQNAIRKTGGWIIEISKGFGYSPHRVFYPDHMIERIEY